MDCWSMAVSIPQKGGEGLSHIQYNTLLNGPNVLFLQGGVRKKSGFPQCDHLLLMQPVLR